MKIAIICIKQYLNVHQSIKNIFPEYDLFQCSSDPENIQKLYNKIKSFYQDILITSHNITYKSSKSYVMEYHPLDYIGGDYYGIPYASIGDLFIKTCDDPLALGFNNKGYIKKEIVRERLVKNDYLGPNGGSFLYSSKVDNSEHKCNVYLPSSYLDLLPKLSFTRVKVIHTEKTLKIALLLEGYLGGWFYAKDSLQNIVPANENLNFSVFASCYPTIQSTSTNTVSAEKLYKELSTNRLNIASTSGGWNNIASYNVAENPDAKALYNKYVGTFGTKFDLVVSMKFNTIADKEINYFELEPGATYESNNKALQIKFCYGNSEEKLAEPNLPVKNIPARIVEYDIDKTFTFVTCLLDIGRHKWEIGSKKFSDYIDAVCKLTEYKNFRFYIYADEYYIDKIANKLSNYSNFKLIPISFKELYTYKYYDKIKSVMNSEFYLAFLKHLGNTKVPEYCIPEYNTLINCKVDLLYKTSLDNTYNTDYFIWTDLFDTIIPSYWNPLCMQHPDHIMICNQESIENADKTYLSYFKDFSNVLMTNIFGGSKHSIAQLYNAYYDTLSDCLDKNITHNDKFIMSMCFKNNPELFKVFSLKEDVLNSNTLSLNYFRLINTYRVGVIVNQYDTETFKPKYLVDSINTLKSSNCRVELFLPTEVDELKELNPVIYSREKLPSLLDNKILSFGRFDCVVLLSGFDDTQTISKQLIQDCVKQNTLIFGDKKSNSIIYGSYKIMSKAVY